MSAQDDKLGARIGRIRGQLEAVERAMAERRGLEAVLQTIAACRGAMSGLMAEVVESELRGLVTEADGATSEERLEAASRVLGVVRTYLK